MRPSCVNCSSSGRKCDGYTEIQPPKKKTFATSNGRQTEPGSSNIREPVSKLEMALKLARTMVEPGKVGLSTHECFFLDFFRTEGAMDFAGPPYDLLFDRVALQLGTWQPAVKHAAIALTANANTRSQCYWGRFGGGHEKMNNFVLSQTSKSITYLLQPPAPEGLMNRRTHREVLMTTCFLLALLAFCMDDCATFQMHVMHGQRAMREWENADFDNSSIGNILFDAVTDLSFRLQVQSNPALFLQDDNLLLLRAAQGLSYFNLSYISYNMDRYWSIWRQTLFPQDADGFRVGTVDDSTSILRSAKVGAMYKPRIWQRQLKAHIQRVGPLAPQSFHDWLTLLRLWEQVMCAKISAAVAADEDPVWKPLQMRYDVFWVYFRHINELSKKLLQSQVRQDASNPAFPIDQAVVTPLFFCGLHCRDWSIRREALHLIQTWGERFKGSRTTASLPTALYALERIIDIESDGLQPGSVVPESARIHFVEVAGRHGSSNKEFSYLQLGNV